MKLLKNGAFWSILLFIGVAYILVFGVREIETSVSREQLDFIMNSVRRSAVQCYALEGAYPSDLKYLIDEYGLQYDATTYVVHYRNTGGNLLPEISVAYLR